MEPIKEAENESITSFRGEYEYLSNFHPCVIEIDGITYPTAEHAFQALKTLDASEREHVRVAPTPAGAKQRGKKVTLRDGWASLRFEVMEKVLRVKFADPNLRSLLIATGERELIEGNTWRDTTWGCIRTKEGTWKGQNQLGKMLMRLRSEYAKESPVLSPEG